jgi:FHS family L-fucose permease-like MFS transporter
LIVGLFNSIMWPTIFSLSLADLGKHTTKGSGYLIMGVVGGALIPLVQAVIADVPSLGLKASFWVAVACYAYLVFFAVKGYKTDKMKKVSSEG